LGEVINIQKKLKSERTESVIAKLHNLDIEGLLTFNPITT
jgi:hypothetical protein